MLHSRTSPGISQRYKWDSQGGIVFFSLKSFHYCCTGLPMFVQTVTASWKDFDPQASSQAIPGLAGVGASTPGHK